MFQFIHVLVNTLVVIPFSTWDVDVPVHSDEDPECGQCRGEVIRRSLSWSVGMNAPIAMATTTPAATAVVTATGDHFCQPNTTKCVGTTFTNTNATGSHPDLTQPNGNATSGLHIHPPPISALRETNPANFGAGVADVRRRITTLWWREPSRPLTLHEVRLREPETLGLQDAETLGQIFDGLVIDGLINKRLYPPQKTQREYFWLLTAHLLFNLLALVVEMVNGGAYTRVGSYYSWDVRLASFFIGILFLVLYYRRYHTTTDLTKSRQCCDLRSSLPVICCMREQEPLVAAPVEEELIKYLRPPSCEELDGLSGLRSPPRNPTTTVTTQTMAISTQTSLIEEKAKNDRNMKGPKNMTVKA